MKKYTPVFGDQSLFDGAPEDAIAVRVNDYKKITYYHHTEEDLKSKSMQDLHAIPIVAMRRIEEVPVWTVEDQKAGRLPEVGSDVWFGGESCAVIGISNTGEVCVDFIGQLFLVYIEELNPIETQAEKSQRLRDEWVEKAFSLASSESYVLELQTIYDALLSGELSAPTKIKEIEQ